MSILSRIRGYVRRKRNPPQPSRRSCTIPTLLPVCQNNSSTKTHTPHEDPSAATAATNNSEATATNNSEATAINNFEATATNTSELTEKNPTAKPSDPNSPCAVSPITRHWETAYKLALQELSDEEAKIASLQVPSLNTALKTIKDEIDKRAADGRTFIENGKQVSVKDKFSTILKNLDKHAKLVDVFIQHHPDIVALVWGAMRSILQMGINYIEAMDSMSSALDEITRRLESCNFYAAKYQDLQHSYNGLQPNHLDNIKNNLDTALPRFCAAVMVFLVKANSYFKDSIKDHMWKALQSFSVTLQPYLDEIECKERTVKDFAEMATMQKVDEIHIDVRKLLGDEHKDALHKGRLWLRAASPEKDYQENLRHKTEGTCNWIFQNEIYKNWNENSRDRRLWIKGKPGAGKSVLSAAIIERLLSNSTSGKYPQIVLYFYFRNGDTRTSKAVGMATSLVDQLILSPAVSDQKKLIEILSAHQKNDNTGTCSEFHTAWKILVEMLHELSSNVVIVLDALDECDDRGVILECLSSKATLGARTIITSRPETDITEKFHSVSGDMFSVIGMNVDRDIENFVAQEVNRDPRLKRFKDDIINTLQRNSDGMFRYAALVMGELNLPTQGPRGVKDILAQMPRGLNGMYRHILLRLERTNADLINDLCRKMLLWISMAYRPITVDEMAYAFSVGDPDDYESNGFDPEQQLLATRDHMLLACGSLIEIFNGDKLRFSHLSVKEFLLQPREKMSEHDRKGIEKFLVDVETAHGCIAINAVAQLSLPAMNVSKNSTSALDYSVNHWTLHASQAVTNASNTPNTWKAINSFFNCTNAFEKWKHVFSNFQEWDWANWFRQQPRDRIERPIDVIASYGLSPVFATGESEVHSLDACGRSPLLRAVRFGHEDTVNLLLERSANFETKDRKGRSPLSYAVSMGHEGIVKLLLERGADVENTDEGGRSPLSYAAQYGEEGIVKRLLERGADVKTTDEWGRSPLSHAAECGDEGMAKLLLERGADVETKNMYGRSPLSYAAESGHEGIAKLLLERGADVETKDRKGRSPLSYAAESGHEGIAKLLLERGADVETKDRKGRSPLSYAAESGHEGIAKLLLERGADFETKDGCEQSPLSYAAESGHEGIAKLL
ncbi:hypothetical protein EDC01DRAFT_791105, partial [Geopyxis carbonaria]